MLHIALHINSGTCNQRNMYVTTKRYTTVICQNEKSAILSQFKKVQFQAKMKKCAKIEKYLGNIEFIAAAKLYQLNILVHSHRDETGSLSWQIYAPTKVALR